MREVIGLVSKAIIPAAGYGTRNLPVTKAVPKELFPISGRPAIDYIVKEAENAGITEILIILSRNKTEIMNYFDRSIELEWHLSRQRKERMIEQVGPAKVNIQYIRQPDALGLGHAIQLSRSFVGDDPFAVMLPDQVSLSQPSPLLSLLQLYVRHKCPVIGLQRVPLHLLQNYGVTAGTPFAPQVRRLQSIVEKPKSDPPSRLAVMGRYVLTPDIFPLLDQIMPDGNGELQLTDALNALCRSNQTLGYVFKEKWYDISIERQYLNIQRRAYLMKRSGIW